MKARKYRNGVQVVMTAVLVVVATILVRAQCVRFQSAGCHAPTMGWGWVVCKVIPPELDYCAYTDTQGYVNSCGGVYTNGFAGCIYSQETCTWTKTYTSCCSLVTLVFSESKNVNSLKTNATPCP